MNAWVDFKVNGLGNLYANRSQREEAMKRIASTFLARLGLLTQTSPGTTAPVSPQKTATLVNPAAKTDAASVAAQTQELDRDAFLRLLVMQLQNQDPLEPVGNVEMVAQLAQFSALEQMTNLNTAFGALRDEVEFLSGNMDQLNFISAQGLLGKYVTGLDVNGQPVSGRVEAVGLNGSIVMLTIGEQQVPMSGVLTVQDERPAAGTSPTAAAPSTGPTEPSPSDQTDSTAGTSAPAIHISPETIVQP
jgi:flagellar basal-body rod modification protein FlgD